jgi:hypothetical protein
MSTSESGGRYVAVIEDFRAIHKNSLRGFARVRLPSGLILHDVGIHTGGDHKAWASPPSRPMLDHEDRALRGPDGKIIRYATIIAFATKEHRDRFSQVVVDAMREAHPEALT